MPRRRTKKNNKPFLCPHDPMIHGPLPDALKPGLLESIGTFFGAKPKFKVLVDKKGNLYINSWPDPAFIKAPQGTLVQTFSDRTAIRDAVVDASSLPKNQGGCDMKAVAATPCVKPVLMYDTGDGNCRNLPPPANQGPSQIYDARVMLFGCNATATSDQELFNCLTNVAKNVCQIGPQPIKPRDVLIAGGSLGGLCLLMCIYYCCKKRNARNGYVPVADQPVSGPGRPSV